MGTEIQDFAASLSGLKQRSGLSYGVLAQKLHMSTSTVHRYCNGDAVPHDYAPVERFARVCRASSDELVALHRQWILADEAKRRGTRKGEAGGAVPAPESQAVPEPEQEPEPEPEPMVEDVTPDERAAGAAPAAGRLSGNRLRVLLAAATVVALTVPTALVISNFTGDRSREGSTNAAHSDSPVVPGSSGTASSLGPSPSPPSPSVSAPSAKPSETAGKPITPQAPDGKGRRNGPGGVPVTATISSYNWESPCGQYYLLDEEPHDVPPPPVTQDRRSWAAALGGVDAGDMKLELTLQGASQEAVVLHGLHVRVLSQKAALDRPAYSMGEGCGGGITPQTFDIDLDDSRPRTKPVAGTDGGKAVPAKDFPYRVSSTDVEVFNIDAHVEDHDVTWYLELEWSSGGRSGTVRVDDNGKPFHTSSFTDRPEYIFWSDKAQWMEKDATDPGEDG